MARLALASPTHLDAILSETHELWGTGLTLGAYRSLWNEVAGSAWARDRVRYHVWLADDGTVLWSAKLYRPLIRLHGRRGRCQVLGAIYTPREQRRRGYATALIRCLLEAEAEPDDLAALLFSDIGTKYYSRFDFRPLTAREHWGRLPQTDGPANDVEFRPATRDDLESMRQAHEATSRNRPLAIVRDAGHWEFLWTRSIGFFSRLADRRVVQRWGMAMREGKVIGYLLAVEGHGEWNLREVGSVDGEARTLAAIVRAGGRRARQSGLRRFYGWFPPDLPRALRGWGVRSRSRRRPLPMIRTAITEVGRSGSRSATAYLPFLDQF